MIARHCTSEGWTQRREDAKAEVEQKVILKTAEDAAENAVKAQRIKARLLDQLEKLAEAAFRATEERSYDLAGNLTEINRLRDLTAAYKDLTGDLPRADASEDALQRARDILGGVKSVIE